jgi:phosphoenolpyruvate-protein phosphotransferase (PTS system enzyme I)
MQRIFQYIDKINKKTVFVFIVALIICIIFIDFITRHHFQLELLYVFPIGIAAWKNEKVLALTISIIMPFLRILFDIPLHTELLSIAFINALLKAVVMIALVYLIDITVKNTKRLQKTITKNAIELTQLRAFARMSTTLQGRGLSPGMAEGVALVYTPPENEFTFEHHRIEEDGIEIEIKRLNSAVTAAIEEINATQKKFADDIVAAENALLEVHMAILKDIDFWSKCRQRVRENLVSAEQAVIEEITELVAMMKNVKQEYLRERSADIHDIGRLVLRNIRNSDEREPNRLMFLPPNTILIAKELLPSDLMRMDRTNLAALITEHNSPSSHVAILARARNIPAISDIKDATSLLASGDRLLIDAEAGTVTVEPTKSQADRFSVLKNQYITPEQVTIHAPIPASTTKDGVRIHLFANISRTDEAYLAAEYQMDGVGLFRSEFLFLDVIDPPDLDAQCAMYSVVANTLHPRPVVIRTVDFGGDKIPSFDKTENDVILRMGKRGLSFSLTEKTMFRIQIRAILRAAQVNDNIRIMFPMVMSVTELHEAFAVIDEIFEQEQFNKRPLIGAMIETPAAVFDIHEIVKIVDFISIGTNDLAHFILAMDRQSQYSTGALSFLHPSVLRATEQIIGATLNGGKNVTVCGEAAGNPVTACLLLGMGVRNLSMNPFQASRIRHVFQQLTINQTETAAREALIAKSSEDIKQIVTSIIRKAEDS